MVTPEEETEEVKQTEPSERDMMTHVDIPYNTQVKILELERQIRNAERMCERAESDPREKAICEDASAEVQLRKKKIKELENQ